MDATRIRVTLLALTVCAAAYGAAILAVLWGGGFIG